MKVIVVGSGKLANAILSSKPIIAEVEVCKWEQFRESTTEKVVVVHAGSGRQLGECLDFCSRTKSVMIELSTGLQTENLNPDFPLIVCPNTSILILKMMHLLQKYGNHFVRDAVSITESHQSSKKTEPGTAYAFAQSLQVQKNAIQSIRDPNVQRKEIGIPEEFLDKHAFHRIVISDGTDEIKIETKVLGHNSYSKGVNKIIEAIANQKLENRRYSVLELIEKQII